MYTLLTILHILVAVTLMLVVLIQHGKGSDIGAAFGGGSSQTVFGGRGAATVLHKITAAAAALFMLSSLALTVLAARRGSSSIILEERPGASAPAQTPGRPAPQGQQKPQPTSPVPTK
ncbi:MAG: preprotein translocase subunit SecG [candidate division NC10 bacterium]|nr:preprotein translocase subunit SecG [candidate division NC10 bacterium]